MSAKKWLVTGLGAYAAYVGTTWLRYGRADRTDDVLLDRFMPRCDVSERHAIEVDAPAHLTLSTAKELQLDASWLTRAIFRARELILRSEPDTMVRPAPLVEAMKSIGWGVLADEPSEIVMGAATKPWEPNPVFRPLAPDEFVAFCEPGFVKIAWTLRVEPTSGGCVFRTDTRAVATDREARRRFRVYWALLSPGIILIRRAMLPIVKSDAERRAHVIERHAERCSAGVA